MPYILLRGKARCPLARLREGSFLLLTRSLTLTKLENNTEIAYLASRNGMVMGLMRENMFLPHIKILLKYFDVKSLWLPDSWFNFLFIFTKIEGFSKDRKSTV